MFQCSGRFKHLVKEQGQKRLLDTPERKIEKSKIKRERIEREREREREKERERQ